MEQLATQMTSALLLSMRIAPALSFAPPFTLLRVPASVRLLLSISLAMWLVAANPEQTLQSANRASGIAAVAAAELLLGLALALSLQIAFAALLVAGRAIDLQAGFGLAMLIDPTSNAQTPLTGTFFAYATAAIFFLTDGPAHMLAIWSASVDQMPLGAALPADSVPRLIGYMSAIFVMAMGAGGLAMLVLFLVDLAIAFMSRTLPQMNVLVLGFQVKTLTMLIVLPLAMALSASLFLRMLRYALETSAELIRHG
jgi:flagellar biosynthetic protein FliR